MNESSLQLSSGLTISYASFGDPHGRPALYFHGLPGSRQEGECFHHACQQHHLHLIAPDRFGYGDSSPVRNNRYLCWVDAMQELAAKLALEHFYVFANSGGAPYALACASILKDQVIATGICGGLGPLVIPELRAPMQGFTRLAIRLAGYSPWLLRLTYGVGATLAARHFSATAIDMLAKINGEPDKTTMARADVKQMLIRNFHCAFSQGARGAIDDLIVANEPWPFELAGIRPLYLWAGDQDRVVPCRHSQWIKQHAPHAKLELIPGEGHFSLPYGYAEHVVTTVMATE